MSACEDLMCDLKIFPVCYTYNNLQVLQLFVLTTCEYPINPIIKSRTLNYSHATLIRDNTYSSVHKFPQC
jgi:hypothetical protein